MILAAGRSVTPRAILARWNSNVWCDRIWLSTCRFWFVAVCQYSSIRLTRWSFWKCFASVSFSHWDGFSNKHSNPIIEICLITCFIWWSRVHLSHSVLLAFSILFILPLYLISCNLLLVSNDSIYHFCADQCFFLCRWYCLRPLRIRQERNLFTLGHSKCCWPPI